MNEMDTHFWQRLLAVYLHDPPDKALDIRGHTSRAGRYYKAVFGIFEDVEKMKTGGDAEASRYERLPTPNYKEGASQTIVSPSAERQLLISHPLQAGDKFPLKSLPAPPVERIAAHAKEISAPYDDARLRYYAIWRHWKDRLETEFDWAGRLPAETRAPDHTIWNHLDTTAAFAAAELRAGKSRRWGLLSFKISPVQTFIEQARSTRDVFTGSFLLAWLAFKAMEPVIRSYGPTAMVFPYLRGTPLMDWWLKQEGVEGDFGGDVLRANYPNRFVALVADGDGEHTGNVLSRQVVESCKASWKEIASSVKQHLNKQVPFGGQDFDGWDLNWDAQINSFFSIQSNFLPCGDIAEGKLTDTLRSFFGANSLEEISEESEALTKIAKKIEEAGHRTGYKQQQGEWQFVMQLSALLMDTQSRIKHVPPYQPQGIDGKYAAKCTLLGTYEQMGPADRARSDAFWKMAQENSKYRIREGERLSAIALVKRLSFPAYFDKKFDKKLATEVGDTRFSDTATLAAKLWLRKADVPDDWLRKSEWNGQWLHGEDPEATKDNEDLHTKLVEHLREAKKKDLGKPPTYYAILLMDGDSMGDWLGAKHPSTPKLRDAYAKELVDYFRSIQVTEDTLSKRRAVGPALHAAISEALGHFSTEIVPAIVKHYDGELIYAGGDDVLAFLPLENALACAHEIQKAYTGADGYLFKGDQSGWITRTDNRNGSTKVPILTMGANAGISAGIAIVHYHEDLRVAFDHARAAEKLAKTAKPSNASKAPKNRLGIALAKRSGEILKVNCSWNFVPILQEYTRKFQEGATDAWARQVQREIAMWEALEQEVKGTIQLEIGRAIVRSEQRRQFQIETIHQQLEGFIPEFGRPEGKLVHGKGPHAEFLNLIHTASFMARGRDE